MTLKLIGAFPNRGGKFQVEPDASSGSYFWGACWLLTNTFLESAIFKRIKESGPNLEREEFLKLRLQETRIVVPKWPDSHLQIDADFTIFVDQRHGAIPIEISRVNDLGDSIMTAVVLSPSNTRAVKFSDLGRLRLQETERVVALRTELTKCGAKVIEEGDTLTVYPSQLHGAEIDTYNDHRMAMCFAILGLKVPGIKLKNPACVKKTFPNFFQKLAAAPPHGLGATILDAKTGRQLSHDELFAE